MLQCGDYHSQVIVLVNVVTFYASCFCHFTCNVQHLLSNHCPVRLKSTSVTEPRANVTLSLTAPHLSTTSYSRRRDLDIFHTESPQSDAREGATEG